MTEPINANLSAFPKLNTPFTDHRGIWSDHGRCNDFFFGRHQHCRCDDVAYLCSRARRDPICRTGNQGEAVAGVILLAKHAQHVVLIHFPIALLLSEPCSISYREEARFATC